MENLSDSIVQMKFKSKKKEKEEKHYDATMLVINFILLSQNTKCNLNAIIDHEACNDGETANHILLMVSTEM